MKRTSFRQGSALLIVLGMMAFMIVSAVGFSVFMRESRKPSSHLRRNITARLLLRAALANAIARVDGDFNTDEGLVEGVYDDLYPGVGPAQAKPIEENGDFWDRRVFMPFGSVDPRHTVSTLTLESLAYLPPAIINEARVWSRLTRTAEWKNLSYDLGRYAFCAVDVSDCFDINKVRANERRSSASNRRFNLSSLYPDNAQQLDDVLDKVVDQDPASFISLADFNVVAGRGCPFAPWMSYIGMGDAQIYERDDYKAVSNALFVTDTWFPPTNAVGAAAVKTYNLEAGGKNQPWPSFSDSDSIETVLDKMNDPGIGAPLMKMLQGVGVACLYDYLDQDQVPISYVMPCTETAPMVCALGLDDPVVKMSYVEAVHSQGKFGTPVMQNGQQVYPYTVTVKRHSLKVDVNALGANGVLAFPFKRAHLKSDYEKTFSGDALFRVFFGPAELKSRLSAGATDDYVHPLHGRKWDAERTGWNKGVYTAYARNIRGELNFSKPITRQVEALGDFNIEADCGDGTADFTLFYTVEVAPTAGGASENWYSFDGMKNDPLAFLPRNEDGVDLATADSAVGKAWKGYLAGGRADAPPEGDVGVYASYDEMPSGRGQTALGDLAQLKLRPHFAVWVRLFSDDDTYDVVPARPEDDELYGDRDLPNPRAEWGGQVAGGDDVAPVLSFRDANEVEFDITTLQAKYATPVDLKFDDKWNRLYVADPRYNFAPENWFAVKANNGNVAKKDWLDAVTPLLGESGRDCDIFMFTSDQEYLQSAGELEFLPRVGDAATPGNQMSRHYIQHSKFEGKPFDDRIGADADAVLGKLGQKDLYWRTYAGFDNGAGVDAIYSMREGGTRADDGTPCEIVSGVNDFRANPFSQDERIIAAVVEDTPFDYFAASTNKLNTLYSKPEDATPSDAKNYVFTGTRQTSAAYIKGFSRLAEGMRQEFYAGAQNAGRNTGWQDIYDRKLQWASDNVGDEQKDIFGIDLNTPLHCVDRKFLHAFWRECFQNRQQLFLLFLRAEPLTVGGMGFGSLAATQLGARGVALLWRDPEPPSRRRSERQPRDGIRSPSQWREAMEMTAPHRTRVLFYHPID